MGSGDVLSFCARQGDDGLFFGRPANGGAHKDEDEAGRRLPVIYVAGPICIDETAEGSAVWGSTSVDEAEVAGGTQVPKGPVKGMLVGSAGDTGRIVETPRG